MPVFLSIGEAMVEFSHAAETTDRNLWQLGFAGDTLNTAWYLRARLPQQWSVQYFTRLGRDQFSPQLLQFLQKHDIGTDFIAIDNTRSVGLYTIHLDEGERSFSYWRGNSAARGLTDDLELLDRAFHTADAIYLSGITLAILSPTARGNLLARLEAARRAGKITAFDPNIRPKLWETTEAMREWLTAAARGATILLPSFDDDNALFGDSSAEACARRWAKAGAAEVVVKNNGGPMTLLDETGLQNFNVVRRQPTDTTGAGDSFNGAYLAARLAGKTSMEAIQEGHALALQVIAKRGALVPFADLQ